MGGVSQSEGFVDVNVEQPSTMRMDTAYRTQQKRTEGALYRGGTKAQRFGNSGPSSNSKAKHKAMAEAHKTPGPGQYVQPDYWQQVDRVALRQMEREAATDAPVQWMRVPTAPSIPGRSQAYG